MNTPVTNKANTARVEVLSLERHRNLKFHIASSFSFAQDWFHVPVHHREAARLGRSLPVCFISNGRGELMPCLLLKVPGKAAVDGAGRWLAPALPDLIRVYPFGWMKSGNRNQLTVYPEAPHFAGPGKKLITSRGKPTQQLNRIRQALGPIQTAFDETRTLMEELKALKVLMPFNLIRGEGENRRTQTLWAVTDPKVVKTPGISHRLRTLLYVHQQSARELLKGVQQAEGQQPSTGAASTPAARPEAQKTRTAGEDVTEVRPLIEKACQQFGVTLDDLRSRKRSDSIKKARTALVNDAAASDCLEALAIELERTVDTLKKWM